MIGVWQAGPVLRGPVSTVFVPFLFTPSVVDYDFVLARRFVEQPSQQLFALPIARRHIPFAVGKDYCRFTLGDEVFELRDKMFLDKTLAIGQPKRVVPLVKRVVVSHLDSFFPDSIAQLLADIAFGTNVNAVPLPAP